MIETIYLEIIILLVLIWLFESKIMPQTIILFLAFSIMIHEVNTLSDIRANIGTLMLLATLILYSGLQIAYASDNQGE